MDDQVQARILSAIEVIRKRPGMYVGSTDSRGLHNLIFGFIDISEDDALGGLCKYIKVTLNQDGSFIVENDSPPIPIIHNETKEISFLEQVMTMPRRWGELYLTVPRFSKSDYWMATTTNALSEWGWVEIRNKDGIYRQYYTRGLAQTPVTLIKKRGAEEFSDYKEGNTFCFKPDPQIFDTIEFDFDIIAARGKVATYGIKGLQFHLEDRRLNSISKNNELIYYFEDGILSYIKELNQNRSVLPHEPIHGEGDYGVVWVEVAIQYLKDNISTPPLLTLINNIPSEFYGTQALGFREAISGTFRAFALENGLIKSRDRKLTFRRLKKGLVAIVNMRHPQPYWFGPLKNLGLNNPDARIAVRTIVGKALTKWLTEQPDEARKIIENALVD